MRILLGFVLIIKVLISPSIATEIEIGVLISENNQKDIYLDLFRSFSEETGIKVTMYGQTELQYKKELPIWLLEGKGTPDVIFWNASERLFFYTRKGLIHPITHLWDNNHFNNQFSHFRESVTYNNEIYAVPFSYYHWGIYYDKAIIKKFGNPPKTWQEFISICQKMKQAGITPIGIGTKNDWPAQAWFDYINLRINGLDFHKQLLQGKISFYDKRVERVFSEWKMLIDNDFFNQGAEKRTWDELLPEFYRGWIGFMLLGNFVAGHLPKMIKHNIGFIAFPKISDIPSYENAPTDIFMIPKSSTQIEAAEKFIKFVAQADVQSHFNKQFGYLPPNAASAVSQSELSQAGKNLLDQAEGIAQYFDRDTIPEFAKKAAPILAGFINSGDLQEVSDKLEKARLDVFSNRK